MKNKQAIEIIKDIAGQYNNPAEKRAFEKAVAALEYCKNLTYYIENKQFKNISIDGFREDDIMGRSIYFTDRELQQVRDYVFEAVEILGEASETYEQVDKDMEDGLGSALRKLYKGCNGESKYAKYKTKRG